MSLTTPYVIYGTIKHNGVLQTGENVTVTNLTTNESHTVQTDRRRGVEKDWNRKNVSNRRGAA